MKIKLFVGNEETVKLSGIGKAFSHQQQALELNEVPYTTDNNDQDFDLIHVNTAFPSSLLAIRRAKKAGRKVVVHAHSTEEDFRNSFRFSNLVAPLWKRWLIYLYSLGDQIITPTPYSKRILEGYGIKVPITAISNGVDLGAFKSSLEDKAKFIEKYDIAADDRVVISVGWIFERKGFDTFVEVARNFENVKFIWFGDVTKSAPTSKICKILRELPDNVIMAGYVDSRTLIGAYSRCDVFFFPSREETEGIVVLEALACKARNIVLRDIPVFEGWMQSGYNCYMSADKADFTAIIADILSGKLEDLSENGYKTAKEREIKEIGKQLIEVYENTLKMG